MSQPNENAVILQDSESVQESEAESSVQDLSSTGSPEETAEVTDWRAEALAAKAQAKEFETAFKGLQGTVQKLVEAQNLTVQEQAKREEKILREKFNSELAGMTETEASFARRAFELEMENRALKAEKASTEPINQRLARDAILTKLSKDYGVTMPFLEEMVQKYNHPLAVAAAAEAAHATRKQLERPKANGRIEGPSAGGTGGDEASLAKLANSGNWEAYWNLIDKQQAAESRRR